MSWMSAERDAEIMRVSPISRQTAYEMATEWGVTFNAIIGRHARLRHGRMEEAAAKKAAKQAELLAEEKRIAKLIKGRAKSRRRDGHKNDKLTSNEKTQSSWLYNQGESFSTIGRILNIDPRTIYGYVSNQPGYPNRVLPGASGKRHRRLHSRCRHCKKRPVARGRHYYCSKECRDEVKMLRDSAANNKPKRKRYMRRYRAEKKKDAEYMERKRSYNRERCHKPEVRARHLELQRLATVARRLGISKGDAALKMGAKLGMIRT